MPGTDALLRDPAARELERSGLLPPGVDAAQALSEVLCALTQRLSGGEAFDLVSSLAPSLRPLVSGCVRNRRERPAAFGLEGFLRRVAVHLQTTEARAEPIARAALAVVRRGLAPGAIGDVASQLPQDLAALWLGKP